MGDFKQDLQDDLDNTFFNKSEFAENAGTVTYYPKAGGSYEVAGIFDSEFEMVDPETNQPVLSRQPMIQVNEDDLQAEPAPEDEIEIRGVRYRVIEFHPDGVGTVALILHKKV